MRIAAVISLFLAVVLLAGCTSHPRVDDLSQATTFSIVNNVRCEVKRQVEVRLQDLLDRSPNPKIRNFRLKNLNRDVKQLGQAGALQFLAKEDSAIAYKVLKYGSIVIGYTFSFGITETNNNSANAGFKLPFTHTTFDLNLKGRSNHTREATRTFALSDTFLDLISLDCSGEEKKYANLAYPIVGSIGADSIINTYLDLGKSGVTSTGGVAGPFKDVLVFTTEIGGEISPKVTIAPVANQFKLVEAGGSFGAGRTDIHSLTIVIPFPTIDDRAGSVFETQAFSPAQYKAAVAAANKTIAYEFCVERALRGNSGSLPGVIKSPEEYCSTVAFR